jgi:hypothetical protein
MEESFRLNGGKMRSAGSVLLVLAILLFTYGCVSKSTGFTGKKAKSAPGAPSSSNTAPDSNWVLAKSKGHLNWKISEYVDQYTVMQQGDTITFWYEIKHTRSTGAEQKVIKVEASLTTHKYRYVETYSYINGKLVKIEATASSYRDSADFKDVINMALKYAKQGNENYSVPAPL